MKTDPQDARRQARTDAAITTAAATWPEVERLFGVRGEPSRCWCRWFALSGPEWRGSDPKERKGHLKARFDDDRPAPGVLAFRNGEPVGWCAVEPRTGYPRILQSRLLRLSAAAAADAAKVWTVSCFVVAPGHRRSGVAAALLAAAVAHAFGHGAEAVEGYPVDPQLRPRAGAADLYQGTVGLFVAGGFSVVDTPIEGRSVVSLPRAEQQRGEDEQGNGEHP